MAFGLHAQASHHELPALHTRQEAVRAQEMMKDKVDKGLPILFRSLDMGSADDEEEEAEDITGSRGALCREPGQKGP